MYCTYSFPLVTGYEPWTQGINKHDKATLCWSLAWRIDWCTDFRANGKKYIAFLHLFLNADRPEVSKTLYGLKIGLLLSKIQPFSWNKSKSYFSNHLLKAALCIIRHCPSENTVTSYQPTQISGLRKKICWWNFLFCFYVPTERLH